MLPDASLDWVVDGGITPDNAASAVAAGATILVCGRAVFRGGTIARNLEALRGAAVRGGMPSTNAENE